MNLSEIMVAHLNELLYSINLLYQYNMAEQNNDSIHLRLVIVSIYEVIKSKDLNILNKKTEMIANAIDQILSVKEEENEVEKIINKDSEDDIRFLFRKGMTYSQGKMSKSLCEVIIHQRYFLQYYQMNDMEVEAIKKFLKIVSLFLDKYLELVVVD
jgi:hypothetical protein